MGKTRVHLLAKELGMETKDLVAQLDKWGMRGREDQSLGDIESRETIAERRVRANVIRRRTSRVEVPQAEKQRSEAEVSKAPVAEPQPSVEKPGVTRARVEGVPAQGAPEVETPEEEPLAAEAEPQETSTPFEARETEPPAAVNR